MVIIKKYPWPLSGVWISSGENVTYIFKERVVA